MWALLSLLAGLSDSLRDASSKHWSTSVPKLLLSWSYTVGALPFFLPVLWLRYPGNLDSRFWILLFTLGICHVSGGIMLVRALSLSDFSLCAPMVAFTPVFLLVTGPVLVGDNPSLAGVVGALLVFLGSYLLNLPELKDGIFAPFRALLKEKGVRMMFFLAFLWSLTCCGDRIAVRNYDPLFWGCAQVTAISLLFLPVILSQRMLSPLPSITQVKRMMVVGILNAASFWTYLLALKIAPVHYVICVKRLSILFSILIGRFLFREVGIKDRLLGGVCMILGVFVISLWG